MLIVDDYVDSAEVLSALLEMRGHRVLMATNAEDALRLAREVQPRVVLVDIWLGGESGYDLARALSELPGLEHCRLVAVTGLPERYTQAGCDEAGVQFYRCLTKPIVPAALFEAVEGNDA